MKPSKRIDEIYLDICKDNKCHPGSEMANTYGYQEQAIIWYLDEEYEAQRPCFVCKNNGCKEVHP